MSDTYIAFVDESGDSRSCALGVVILPAPSWLDVHDQLRAFRKRLSDDTGFRMRFELKATNFPSNGGPWHRLRTLPRTRWGIYKAALQALGAFDGLVRTLGVVVPNRLDDRLQAPAHHEAWEVLLERLRTFCAHNDGHVVIVPDEGTPVLIRKLARRKRRFGYAPPAFGGEAIAVPFRQLVDNPLFQPSHESYLMQWADLVAYAAFRTVKPDPHVPSGLWDELVLSSLGEANMIERTFKSSAERPGLIVWPSRLKPGVPL